MADEATLKLVIVGGRGRTGTVGGPVGTSTPPAGRTVSPPPAREVDPGAPTRKRQMAEAGNALDAVASLTATLRHRMGSIVGHLLGSVLDATVAWQKMAQRGQATASGEAVYKAPAGAFDERRSGEAGRYGGYRPDEVPTDKAAYRAARDRREAQADFRRRYPSKFAGSEPSGGLAAARTKFTGIRSGAVTPGEGAAATGTAAGAPAAGTGAASAMGMAEIAGAAAGPLAIVGAVIAGMVALKAVTLSAVDAVGRFATGIASPDPNPAKLFESLGEHVTSSTEKLIFLGNALGILGPVVGDTTRNFGRLMTNLDALAQRYEEFDPILARSVALADVRQTLGDLRRSRELGGDLGRYIDAQSRLQQEYEDLKVQLLRQILPAVTDAVDAARGVLHIVREINRVVPIIEVLAQTSPLIQIIRLLGRIAGTAEADTGIPDPLTTILEERGIFVP